MIDDLCKDHDVIVRQWRDEIKVNSTLGDSVVESANRAEIQCLDSELNDGLWDCMEEGIEHAESEHAHEHSDPESSSVESDAEEGISEYDISITKDVNEDESGPVVEHTDEEDSTLSPPYQQEAEEPAATDVPEDWMGYVIVGDNIDKNIRPSFQRMDHTTISLHHFTGFASKDRINMTECHHLPGNSFLDVTSLLPSKDDIAHMEDEFSILISRYNIICMHANLTCMHGLLYIVY
jgi:hypothetical protein